MNDADNVRMFTWQRRWLRGSAATTAVGLATLATACGSSDSSSAGAASTGASSSGKVVVNVGPGQDSAAKNGDTVTLEGKPKIGMFIGANIPWAKVLIDSAKAEASKQGGDVTVLDNKYDPKVQFQQLQQAAQSKRFNAWIVLPNDSNLDCNPVKDAWRRGIVVTVISIAICNRDTNAFNNIWQPGTLSQVGVGIDTVEQKVAWMRAITEQPWWNDRSKVLLLSGPPLIGSTTTIEAAMKQVPKFADAVVSVANTDFSAASGLSETQTRLRAHPEINVVATISEQLTEGAAGAIKAAGKTGQVRLVDRGATKRIVGMIKDGTVDMSVPYDPLGVGPASVDTILKALRGEKVARNIDTLPASGFGTYDKPLIVTKRNVDSYKPQY